MGNLRCSEPVGLQIILMHKGIYLYFTVNFTAAGPNYSFFNNKVYDDLYQQSFGTTDLKKGWNHQKMDALINFEIPIIQLFYDEVIRFTSKK